VNTPLQPPQDFDFASVDDAASHYFHLPETPRPSGSATQWLTFLFRSRGMFRCSHASHFAVVLRAQLGYDKAGVPRRIHGGGITLGDTSLAWPAPDSIAIGDPAYGGARGAQIESFRGADNFLFAASGSFPDGLCDDTWYRVGVHANDAGYIAYWIDPLIRASGDPQMQCVFDPDRDETSRTATGILIALGRGPHETGPWTAQFRDIRWGWFV
jgi:hypothetical protein